MTKPTGGLAALADTIERSNHGSPCGVSVVLQRLDRADAEFLRGILATDLGTWQHAEIERLLDKAGHKVSRLTIGKHRRGDCRCEKP